MKIHIIALLLAISACMESPSTTQAARSLAVDDQEIDERTTNTGFCIRREECPADPESGGGDGDYCYEQEYCCRDLGSLRCCWGTDFPMRCDPSGPTAPNNPPSAP